GDKVSEEDKTRLNTEIEKAKEVYKSSEDIAVLKPALEELTKVSNEVFTKLYTQANADGAGAGTDGSAGADGAGNNNGGNSGNTDPNNFTDFKTE
ncbi:MAG: molecular chaperone DnaK, partial [Clostridia bacterium]